MTGKLQRQIHRDKKTRRYNLGVDSSTRCVEENKAATIGVEENITRVNGLTLFLQNGGVLHCPSLAYQIQIVIVQLA
jgi:hypothetical protein